MTGYIYYEQKPDGTGKELHWYGLTQYKDAVSDAKHAISLGLIAMVFPEELDFIWEEEDWYFLPCERLGYIEQTQRIAFGESADGLDVDGTIVFESTYGVFIKDWNVYEAEDSAKKEGLTHDEKAKQMDKAWDSVADLKFIK